MSALLTMIALASVVAVSAARGRPVPLGVRGSWKVVFDDEFNRGALDTTKWSTGWLASGVTPPVNPFEQECYDPNEVVESGGELDLLVVAKNESCGGVTRPYASGLVNTAGKFAFTYGFVQARIWLPGGAAISDWPAFWADGQTWPTDGEMDVIESEGGLACWHFWDSVADSGSCTSRRYAAGWHTFGADWEPGSVTYYYDGKRVGTIGSNVTGSPMFLVFDLGVGSYGGPKRVPATMRVDYVRVWQPVH